MDWLNGIDWAQISRTLGDNRIFFEVAGLVLGAGMIGFLLARGLYKGQVNSRSEILRREYAVWRRRESQGGRRLQRAKMDRDFISRKLRRARTA